MSCAPMPRGIHPRGQCLGGLIWVNQSVNNSWHVPVHPSTLGNNMGSAGGVLGPQSDYSKAIASCVVVSDGSRRQSRLAIKNIQLAAV